HRRLWTSRLYRDDVQPPGGWRSSALLRQVVADRAGFVANTKLLDAIDHHGTASSRSIALRGPGSGLRIAVADTIRYRTAAGRLAVERFACVLVDRQQTASD